MHLSHLSRPLLLIVLVATLPGATHATVVSTTVSIFSIDNMVCTRTWCHKPTMMASAVLRKPNGSDCFCGSTTPVFGFDHLGPGDDPRLMVCSGVLIETPFDVVVSLYDMDETQLPNQVPRYQMQLSTTPPGDAIIHFGAFGTNLAISGHDASMILTITTTKVFPTFNATTPRL